MFGPAHYVPILRWKQAERYALKNLHDDDRARITPLIELTPTIFKSRRTAKQEPQMLDPAQVLGKKAKKLLETCLNRPFFLDLRHVTAEVARTRGKIHALHISRNSDAITSSQLCPLRDCYRTTSISCLYAKLISKTDTIIDSPGLYGTVIFSLQEPSCCESASSTTSRMR